MRRLGAAAALLAALGAGGPAGAGPLVFYIHAYTGGPRSYVLPAVNLWDSTRALDDGGRVVNRVPDGTRVEVLASAVRGRDLFFFVRPRQGTSGWLLARFIRATPTPQPGALSGLPMRLWPLADTARD